MYELPDGSQINFGTNRTDFAEIFFNDTPVVRSNQKRNEATETSCHRMTLKSINSVDIDIRESLLSNILVAGGNTLLGGLVERFEKSLFQIAPQVLSSDSDRSDQGFCFSKAV